MKKLCTICLAACLMLTALAAAPGGEASAEEPEQTTAQIIDLSGYGDEELAALLTQVQTEIAARNIEKTAKLPAGTYIFGRDIPVGKYVLRKNQEGHGLIGLAAADDPEDTYPSKLYEFIGDTAYEAYISVEEGDKLAVEFPCELTISVGVLFQ